MNYEQLNLFDFDDNETYKITKPIRLISLFSGYGSQELALKYLGVEYESWRTCEWAIKSIQAFKDIHHPNEEYECNLTKDELVEYLFQKGISSNYNEPCTKKQIQGMSIEELKRIYSNIQINKNMVNIQQVHCEDLGIEDTESHTYICSYSFPCQDLSLAGKGKGMSKKDWIEGNASRSGMLWEVERILDECFNKNKMPEILVMENVPPVHSKKNRQYFFDWINELKSLGYSSFYQDMNAKDYGIPQNRERCIMVSILDREANFRFPKKIILKKRLKNLLEHNVDESYYLTEKMLKYITSNNEKWTGNNGKSLVNKKIASTLNTGEGNRRCDASNYIADGLPEDADIKDIGCKQVASLNYYNFESSNRVYSSDYISPTILVKNGDDARGIKIVEEYGNKRLNETLEKNNVKDGDFIDAYNKVVKSDVAGTITTRVSESNHTFIAEEKKIKVNEKDIESVRGGNALIIPNATKEGYLLAEDGDGVDISGRVQWHRGTVQKGLSQTLKTSIDVGVVVPLKRGYDITIKNPNEEETSDIDELGSYSKNGYNQTKIVEKNGISPTFTENHGEVVAIADYIPKVLGGIGDKKSNGGTQWYQQDCIYDNNVSIAVTTSFNPNYIDRSLRIRKLTCKECFRLMGVKTEDYNNVSKNQSKSSLYHLAGDSIVTSVLMSTFGVLLGIDYESKIDDLIADITSEDNDNPYEILVPHNLQGEQIGESIIK